MVYTGNSRSIMKQGTRLSSFSEPCVFAQSKMKLVSKHPQKKNPPPWAEDVCEHNNRDILYILLFLIWLNYSILGLLCVLDLHVLLFCNIDCTCCSERTNPPLRFKPVWIKGIIPDICVAPWITMFVSNWNISSTIRWIVMHIFRIMVLGREILMTSVIPWLWLNHHHKVDMREISNNSWFDCHNV